MPRSATGWALAATLALSVSAAAGTMRHDVAESQYLALAAEPQFSGVGRIIAPGVSSSGTLIADRWVLTAAHLVDELSGSLSFAIGTHLYSSTEWIIHPDWTGNVATGPDLALVRLQVTPFNATPASLYNGAGEIGSLATIVGYGAGGTGITGAMGNSGTKRAGHNVVNGLGTAYGLSAHTLSIDFDSPASGAADLQPLEYMPASGDSGGGLFIDIGGQMMLAGVTSFVAATDGVANSSYGDIAMATRVADFYDWIASIVPLASAVLPGDLNNDGAVDIFDMAIVSNHWGETGANGGDANSDGLVDIFDVAVVSNHWSAAGAAIVPEPSSGALAGAGGLLAVAASVGLRRRRPIASQRRVRRRQSAAGSIRT